MVKKITVAVFCMGLTALAFAQDENRTRPRLGILPFSGNADGGIAATLLSSRPEILEAFTVVPIPGDAAGTLITERLFRMGSFVDSDIVAGIGNMIGADYVIAGHLRRMGNSNIVIATLIEVGTLRLVAGYHRRYRTVWELRGHIPSMAKALVVPMSGPPPGGRVPSLAVAPLTIPAIIPESPSPRNARNDDLDTLATILAIEIANSGEYAVLPRGSVMLAAFREWETRVTDERLVAVDRLLDFLIGILEFPDEPPGNFEELAAVTEVGRAAGADFVLSLETRALAATNMFVTRILDTETGDPVAGIQREYRGLADGVNLMAEIAMQLDDDPEAAWRIDALNRHRRRANLFANPTRFWSLGVSVGSALNDPWLIGTVQGTLAPLPFSFLRLGFDVGFLSGLEQAGDRAGYFSTYPFAHLAFFLPFEILPIPISGGWYLGAGGGLMTARYDFRGLAVSESGFLADFTTGFIISNIIDISYTMRTDFSSFGSRVSAGFTHRFRLRER